jgi:hypothetical protein
MICATAAGQPAASSLAFRIDEGRNINSFLRQEQVAAHLLLRSGVDPRIIVAFPAGNSGVGLWFAKTDPSMTWTLVEPPRAVTLTDSKGRKLYGIEAQATVDAATLTIGRAVLSSIRVLRDYQALGKVPAELEASLSLEGKRLVWARDRLDGAAGYRLSIEALDDASVSLTAITAGASKRLRLKIEAVSGETPLGPLTEASLLTAKAAADPRSRNALTFLSYPEKYLAGSWRFNTYFGRDTLMSLALLAPVLQPVAMENGLASVLSRLAPNGEVAHEEDIGEFAVLRNISEGRGRSDTPIYDYGMVDDDFMLAPVAANWLLDKASGGSRAPAFLASTGREVKGRHGDALVRNLCWVVERTEKFSRDPQVANLVGIKDGRMTGQWRDSEEGLGRGRYAYDVNAVFVPAALRATDQLMKSALLDPYLSDEQRRVLMRAAAQFEAWSTRAPPLFTVMIPASQARDQIAEYAKSIGIPADRAITSLNSDPLRFNALSLDATGKKIPLMHSDGNFALLFGTPPRAELERLVEVAMRPFPAGLLTPIGLLVANPVFADPAAQKRFTSADYHGTVAWSWHHAVLIAGLDRQLAREDLPERLRARLKTARSELSVIIKAAGAVQTSELWSWSYTNGGYHVEPFGKRGQDVDESNAVQLWSTVFLARPGQ